MPDSAPVVLTPVQIKMLQILSDGLAHTAQELHACLYDDLGPARNILAHLSFIRKHLRVHNLSLMCSRVDGCTWYSITRRVAPASAS